MSERRRDAEGLAGKQTDRGRRDRESTVSGPLWPQESDLNLKEKA